jgi:hypothetical protein
MPWKTESVTEQRLSFVIAVSNQEANLSELSRRYGISRQTGYGGKRYQAAEQSPGWRRARGGHAIARGGLVRELSSRC